MTLFLPTLYGTKFTIEINLLWTGMALSEATAQKSHQPHQWDVGHPEMRETTMAIGRGIVVSHVYDGDLPYPDGKVASFVHVGGQCKYCIIPYSPVSVTEDWKLEHIYACIDNLTYSVSLL